MTLDPIKDWVIPPGGTTCENNSNPKCRYGPRPLMRAYHFDGKWYGYFCAHNLGIGGLKWGWENAEMWTRLIGG